MRRLSELLIRLMLTLCVVNTALAQDNRVVNDRRMALTVTAFPSGERVRFTAPSSVVQIRLEVYNAAGRKMVDNELHGGNVLDWHLLDGQAEHLADGSYLCAVTVKSLSGRIAQKLGAALIEKGTVSVRSTDATQMTPQQAEVIGPVEENSPLTILDEDQKETTTVIAHNGEEGQIVRGRGALSFRLGDFFRGKDTEQMRLTAEGNLGIGVANPEAKLDVAGAIRASQGIIFPDGSIQFSAARKTFGEASRRDGQSKDKRGQGEGIRPEAAGTGTTGQIPKWLDGPNAVLADSVITELNGSIGINGPPNPIYKLDVTGHNRFRGSNVSFYLTGLKPGGNEWLFQTIDADGRFRIFGQDNTTGAERLSITQSGNVGIGTSAPISPLHVAAPVPVLRLQDTHDPGDRQVGLVSFLNGAGVETGWIGFGPSANANALFMNNRAGGNTALGAGGVERLTVTSSGDVGIGTTTPQAKLDVRGEGLQSLSVSGGNSSSDRGGIAASVVGGDSSVSAGGIGVFSVGGDSSSSVGGVGVLAFGGQGRFGATGLAGDFNGNVRVSGNLSKGGGSFKIDHPLDPENKYLYHSFVESPDMMNIYNGVAMLDSNGDATVHLPEWFGALNKDFRYLLTAIGAPSPMLYIAEEISDNRFKIAGGTGGMKVSWQVTGIRQDAYANKHRIQVEEAKPEPERGTYLHPDSFNQPEEKNVLFVQHPQVMQLMKETRDKRQEPGQN